MVGDDDADDADDDADDDRRRQMLSKIDIPTVRLLVNSGGIQYCCWSTNCSQEECSQSVRHSQPKSRSAW